MGGASRSRPLRTRLLPQCGKSCAQTVCQSKCQTLPSLSLRCPAAMFNNTEQALVATSSSSSMRHPHSLQRLFTYCHFAKPTLGFFFLYSQQKKNKKKRVAGGGGGTWNTWWKCSHKVAIMFLPSEESQCHCQAFPGWSRNVTHSTPPFSCQALYSMRRHAQIWDSDFQRSPKPHLGPALALSIKGTTLCGDWILEDHGLGVLDPKCVRSTRVAHPITLMTGRP